MDLLTLMYKESGSAIYNADVKVGEEVVVIGMRGLDGLRALRCDVS